MSNDKNRSQHNACDRLDITNSRRNPSLAVCERRRLRSTLLESACVLTLFLAPAASVASTHDGPATVSPSSTRSAKQGPSLTIALNYANDAPLDRLRAFDIVVVEPDNGHQPKTYQLNRASESLLFAYVSIGEVETTRPWAANMPAAMFAGINKIWKSRIINQAHPDWPEFFVEQVIAPLWKQGYRGFFLDTMDSYQSIATEPRAQQDGLVKTIKTLKARFPSARLIANRGFELLPRIHQFLEVVAAESLFGHWDQAKQTYGNVNQQDRQWILDRLAEAQQYGLQTLAIDYANPANRGRMRHIARKIRKLGVTPYVTDGGLNTIGLGDIEVVPRRVLLIHNSAVDGDQQDSTANRLVAMPLHYLGYRIDLLDITRDPLPDSQLNDRYAAIVGIFEQDLRRQKRPLQRLLASAVAQHVPIALLNSFGSPVDARLIKTLGVKPVAKPLRYPISIQSQKEKIVGLEIPAIPVKTGLAVKAPSGSTSWLSAKDGRGQEYDGVAITPWGGYAVQPFTYVSRPRGAGELWVIDPIEFLRDAIDKLPFRPIADVTTESGRRLFMAHIDGDGFASRAEIPGAPFAAEVMLNDFIARYPVPHTVSVIEGEVGPKGLYPELSGTLERIARDIFALPHVEIASHSYSHPFFWRTSISDEKNHTQTIKDGRPLNLPIKSYRFNLQREIAGSAAYINSRLAPPGKKTKVFLWTGDCVPPGSAIAATQRAGLFNLNGGDTTISYANPSLSLVAPMSLRKQGYLQVFAPNQNENVYTNDWTGPFYGFDRVIETYKLTESPRRLKPIDIYYHTYSASKHSAIAALHRVYRYALSQALNPVYISEYARKVIDYEAFITAREITGPGAVNGRQAWWLIGAGNMNTVRVPSAIRERINWRQSTGLAGAVSGAEGDYLHLGKTRTRLLIEAKKQTPLAHVISANGRIEQFARQGRNFSFKFSSHVSGRLTMALQPSCVARADGKYLPRHADPPRAESKNATNRTPTSVLKKFHYQIESTHARTGIMVSINC